jgi:flagellar hook-length control protein FliK
MTAATAVPATAPPNGAPDGIPPIQAPDGAQGVFAATLTDIATARTATAEGHIKASDDHSASGMPEEADAPQLPATPDGQIAQAAALVVAVPVTPAAVAPAPAAATSTPAASTHTAPAPAAAAPTAAGGPKQATSEMAAPAAAAAPEAAAPRAAAPTAPAAPEPATPRSAPPGVPAAPEAVTPRAAVPPAPAAPEAATPQATAPTAPAAPAAPRADAPTAPAAPEPTTPQAAAPTIPAAPAAPTLTAAPAAVGQRVAATEVAASDVGAVTRPVAAPEPAASQAPAPAASSAPASAAPPPAPAPTTASDDQPSGHADAQQPGTPPTIAPAPAATAPAPAAPHQAAPHHTPRLAVAPEHVQALLRIASHRGEARAHLALKPAELGGVEVRLRMTPQGLVASVTAERPESAQVLQQAGSELRRAFESAGVNVAALDIGLAGDDAGNRAHERHAEAAQRTGAHNRAAQDEELSPTDPDHTTSTTTTIALGALVDVLA